MGLEDVFGVHGMSGPGLGLSGEVLTISQPLLQGEGLSYQPFSIKLPHGIFEQIIIWLEIF